MILAQLVVQKDRVEADLLEFFDTLESFDALPSQEEGEHVHAFDEWEVGH